MIGHLRKSACSIQCARNFLKGATVDSPFFRFGSVWYRHKQAPALHLSAACQQFMPSFGLRISWVFELRPAGCVALVTAEFSLRHNALKVASANFRPASKFAAAISIDPSVCFSQSAPFC